MSEVAAQMREEIASMVAADKSDDQIIEYYKSLYGQRILMVPDREAGKMLFLLPAVLSLPLTSAFLVFIVKMRKAAGGLDVRSRRTSHDLLDDFRQEVQRQIGDLDGV